MSAATVTLSGRCARDAEPINSSTPGARLSIPSAYYKKGEELTMWWKVTVWGRDAEFCLKNVRKGDVVHVTGEPYEYTFTKDGKDVTQNCIDARVFKKVANATQRSSNDSGGWGNKGSTGQGGGWGNKNSSNQTAQASDDPVPF